MKINIQLFGGRGASSSYIAKNKQAKIEIKTATRGDFEGTTYKSKYSIDEKTGQVTGQLDYIVNDKETMVQMIKVYDQFKRQGYATELMKDLQREVGDKDINFDMMTDDGKALIDKIGVITEEKKGKFGISHYKGRIKL